MSLTATAPEGRALSDRVETQTLYLMALMRRLGVTRAEARAEADHAGLAVAEALCEGCGEKAACAALIEAPEPLAEPPSFCPNLDFVALACAGRAPRG